MRNVKFVFDWVCSNSSKTSSDDRDQVTHYRCIESWQDKPKVDFSFAQSRCGSVEAYLGTGMPKKTSEIEAEILRVLIREGALYPMQIVRASPKIKIGSVYAYLGRLKRKKWVSSFAEGVLAPSGVVMHRYRITGIGAKRHDSFENVDKSFPQSFH
jgi:hypothetical protein